MALFDQYRDQKLPNKPIVLLVEDEQAEAELVIWQLMERSSDAFDVRLADSVAQLRQLIVRQGLQPDVILLDLDLPDSQGTKTVKDCQALTDAPIVVLTGLDEIAAQQAAIESGADDYLTKGGESTLLRRAIYYAILRHRRHSDMRLAAAVFKYAQEGILITDVDGTIIDVNQAFSRITGYQRDDVVGDNPRILKSGRQDAEFYAGMWQALGEKGFWAGEIWNRRKDGQTIAVALTINAVSDKIGTVCNYVALFNDITLQKQQQEHLEYVAHYDTLTGLPNRFLLVDRLRQAISKNVRRESRFAVVYIDLDGFKAINDNHGHDAGDRLLCTVAGRMQEALRVSDTLARLGGDEFVALLHDVPDENACLPLLSRLLEAVSRDVIDNALKLRVSASIGVTFYPQQQEQDVDQLLRQADRAMYRAKQAGKNRYHIFSCAQTSET